MQKAKIQQLTVRWYIEGAEWMKVRSWDNPTLDRSKKRWKTRKAQAFPSFPIHERIIVLYILNINFSYVFLCNLKKTKDLSKNKIKAGFLLEPVCRALFVNKEIDEDEVEAEGWPAWSVGRRTAGSFVPRRVLISCATCLQSADVGVGAVSRLCRSHVQRCTPAPMAYKPYAMRRSLNYPLTHHL